jgi:3-isopropylmalate dehydrogenase
MEKVIAVLPGDGIGPEITDQAVKALKAIEKKFGHKFTFVYGIIGASAIDLCGDPYPTETHNLCLNSDAILFGAIGDPKYDNNPAAKVRPEQGLLKMRKELGLYANIRPVEIYESLIERSPLKEEKIRGVDLVVVRELTGGIYFGEPRGRDDNGNRAFDTSLYTSLEVERIADVAFRLAQTRKNHVTLVDKANVLETSRLWREVVSRVHKKSYSRVALDYLFVDNAAMQLVTDPTKFDVILTENMFGDILSDEASVLTGSIGLLPSASYGLKTPLFEPIHGSYPQAAGKNIANPLATVLSSAMLLGDGLGLREEASLLKKCCKKIIDERFFTPDLCGELPPRTTSEVGDRISAEILS